MRAYRNFLPDQLIPSKEIYVKQTKITPTGRVESTMIKVSGYVERRDIVEWRPDVEYNPSKLIYLHEAPPQEAPAVRPPHAPQAADATSITPGLVTRPPEEIDMGAPLRAARAAVVHMLPRQPVATTIAYNRTTPAPPKNPAKPAAAPKSHVPKPAAATDSSAPRGPKSRKPPATPASSRGGNKAKKAKTAATVAPAAAPPRTPVIKSEPTDEDAIGNMRTFLDRLPVIKSEPVAEPPGDAIRGFKSFMERLDATPSVPKN